VALESLLTSAQRSVLVTVPYAHPGEPPVRRLFTSMASASARGVRCGLLLGAIPGPDDARLLATLPFEIRRMEPARSTSGHAKGAVIDGTALVSSANWSSAGLGGNWEAALHIEHPGAAAYYADAWRRDWATAVGLDV
jgi:phosphatidylserine/phosphatidylglycerophosphate/cardiolipin synthase-like enzyme